MNKSTFALLIIFVLTGLSCKKDKPEPVKVPETTTLTLVTDNVQPGQIVLSQASRNVKLNADAKITVGNRETSVFADDNNRIGFVMPVLPAGKVKVDYTRIGFPATLEVNIVPYTEISDPQTVLDQFILEVDKVILNLEEHVQSPIVKLEPQHIKLIKYLNQTIKDNYPNLTDDEKKQFAYVLQANMLNESEFKLDSLNDDFYLKTDSEVDAAKELVRQGGEFAYNLIVGIPTITAGFTLAIQPVVVGFDKLAATGFLLVGVVHISNAISNAKCIASLKGIAEKIESEFALKTANPIPFEPDIEKRLGFKATYRNLNLGDNSSGVSVVSGIFKSLNELESGYNKMVEIANKVISWFPGNNPEIPPYQNPIAANSGTKQLNLPGDKLAIKNVSNPEINLNYITEKEGLKLTATSSSITEETPFTFTIQYTDSDLGIKLEREVQAIFEKEFIPQWYTCSYRLLTASSSPDICSPLTGSSGKFYLYNYGTGKCVLYMKHITPGFSDEYLKIIGQKANNEIEFSVPYLGSFTLSDVLKQRSQGQIAKNGNSSGPCHYDMSTHDVKPGPGAIPYLYAYFTSCDGDKVGTQAPAILSQVIIDKIMAEAK